jgi:hypothetical protein
MPTVHVHLGERSYDIIIDEGEGKGIGPFARERTSGGRALVVTDEHLALTWPRWSSTGSSSTCAAGTSGRGSVVR